jgi:hypothetical protein
MSSIKCFGVHYSLDKVEWDEFAIFGWEPKNLNWVHEPDEPEFVLNSLKGVYILQDDDRKPLYVGRAAKLGNRLWSHTRNQNRMRWTHFSWFGLDEPKAYQSKEPSPSVRDFESDSEADKSVVESASLKELEAFLITAIDPPLNKRGGDWIGSKQLLQWSYADEISLRHIDNQIRKVRKKLKKTP